MPSPALSRRHRKASFGKGATRPRPARDLPDPELPAGGDKKKTGHPSLARLRRGNVSQVLLEAVRLSGIFRPTRQIARSLRRTLDNMTRPCSLNVYGRYRRPPRPEVFEVPIWNLKASASSRVR